MVDRNYNNFVDAHLVEGTIKNTESEDAKLFLVGDSVYVVQKTNLLAYTEEGDTILLPFSTDNKMITDEYHKIGEKYYQNWKEVSPRSKECSFESYQKNRGTGMPAGLFFSLICLVDVVFIISILVDVFKIIRKNKPNKSNKT